MQQVGIVIVGVTVYLYALLEISSRFVYPLKL